MPPPWSSCPATALKAMEMSTSLYLPSSRMQRLKIGLSLVDVWASTSGPPGAVLSSTIFQTLPSALPVTPDFQPAGSSPTFALGKVNFMVGSPAQAADMSSTPVNERTRMVRPPHGCWDEASRAMPGVGGNNKHVLDPSMRAWLS